ncbi:MAG: hypothetical protein Q8P29_03540 [Candidatus Levybacteria bacterium]|nr:hypothetical protein [Candidatus Levybacteria bacterium]
MPPVEGYPVLITMCHPNTAQVDMQRTQINGEKLFIEHYPPQENEPILCIIREERKKIGELTGQMTEDPIQKMIGNRWAIKSFKF